MAIIESGCCCGKMPEFPLLENISNAHERLL
jgi:hypothetical protein